MAVFVYQALNKKGRNVKGVIDAESVGSARRKLKAQGIFPTAISEGREREKAEINWRTIKVSDIWQRKKRISTAMLAVLTRQLSTLVAAGMPLVEALKALSDQIDQTAVRAVIAEVTDRVNEGSTLAAALRNHPHIFPRLYANMVASGESSGSLDLVLERLADLLERQAALQRKVLSALTYPCLMLTLCFGVILLLLAYVVPQITSIFADRKATLPLPTRIIIGLSAFVKSYWWALVLLVLGLVIFLRLYAKTERGRRRFHYWQLKLPVLGPLAVKIAASRLARNLGLMLSSGIELLTAMAITRNIIGNVVLEEAIQTASEGVREGRGLARELEASKQFPRLLIHMTAVGERTGQLESMLQRAADVFEAEVDAVISAFTSILEPLLIVFLAGVVGAILASVMLPMIEMTSLVKP